MKTVLLTLTFTLISQLAFAEDLHRVIINKVTADHSMEMKNGDFSNRRALSRNAGSPRITSPLGDKNNSISTVKSAAANFMAVERHEASAKGRLATVRPAR